MCDGVERDSIINANDTPSHIFYSIELSYSSITKEKKQFMSGYLYKLYSAAYL
jgi:hypothetical protein